MKQGSDSFCMHRIVILDITFDRYVEYLQSPVKLTLSIAEGKIVFTSNLLSIKYNRFIGSKTPNTAFYQDVACQEIP